MAESTLQAQYRDLAGDVGFHLGYGRGADNDDDLWTDKTQRVIDQCVKGGLRKFYYCGYEWSFLKPVATLTLPEGEQTIPMPDDFGGIEGRITLSPDSANLWEPIPLTSEGHVRERYLLNPSCTGRPVLAASQPLKGTSGDAGQRFQLFVFPEPDADYDLQFQYYVNPDYLSGAFPYAYGGPEHAQTLLAACKATAEQDIDDVADGPQKMEFLRLLEQSQRIDRRHKPQTLGYNGDRSDRRDWRLGRRWDYPTITYNGVAR